MISVLLATHNGSDTIARTLGAMSVMRSPADGWELVVVNNASTDDTERLVLAWRDRLPLRYIVESRLGKAIAINTGLDQVTGDLIVMTDDDVLPDADWLLEWRRVADALPQCSVFGGAIIPEFDGPPPAWPMPGGGLHDSVRRDAAVCGGRNRTAQCLGREHCHPGVPFGAGLAVR